MFVYKTLVFFLHKLPKHDYVKLDVITCSDVFIWCRTSHVFTSVVIRTIYPTRIQLLF